MIDALQLPNNLAYAKLICLGSVGGAPGGGPAAPGGNSCLLQPFPDQVEHFAVDGLNSAKTTIRSNTLYALPT